MDLLAQQEVQQAALIPAAALAREVPAPDDRVLVQGGSGCEQDPAEAEAQSAGPEKARSDGVVVVQMIKSEICFNRGLVDNSHNVAMPKRT